MILILINKVFSLFNFKLLRLSVPTSDILPDVFKTNYNKRVLISYIKGPFIEGIKHHHTNYLECYTAAEVFNKLGYAVDVINLDSNEIIDYSKYKIVYGIGTPLENVFYSNYAENIIKIFYATGCMPFYSYQVSMQKVLHFYNKTGLIIPQSSRINSVFWMFQYTMPDLLISLGNDFVRNTFLTSNSKLNSAILNAFYIDALKINLDKKDFESSKKHFIWFGSAGLLHKGLDVVIDVFLKQKELTLHICGASKEEKKFFSYYKPIINKCDNIIDHGFIDINNAQFENLMNQCLFAISPSVSEGGSPALLNLLANGGLIPIASKACGLDLNEYGWAIDEVNTESFTVAVNETKNKNSEELKILSKSILEYFRSKYSYENYRDNLKTIITKQL